MLQISSAVCVMAPSLKTSTSLEHKDHTVYNSGNTDEKQDQPHGNQTDGSKHAQCCNCTSYWPCCAVCHCEMIDRDWQQSLIFSF